MKRLQVPEAAAQVLFGAIAGVSEHPEDLRTRHLLRFVADEVGVVAPALLEVPTAEVLAAGIPGPAREAVVQRLVLAAMLVPPLTTTRLAMLKGFAVALGRADEPALVDLGRALRGRHRLLTLGLMRRFPPNERVKAAWRSGAAGSRWRMVKAMLRLGDAATAERYRGLAELPADTLGHRFVAHCRAHGFALPGERGGLPEAMVFHDMGHVLLGEGTDVGGETRVAGFEAGCMGERGFTMLEFTLLLFNLGVRLPAAATPEVGAVDVEALLAAHARGRDSGLDVLAWQPWADVACPVAELRARYGVA